MYKISLSSFAHSKRNPSHPSLTVQANTLPETCIATMAEREQYQNGDGSLPREARARAWEWEYARIGLDDDADHASSSSAWGEHGESTRGSSIHDKHNHNLAQRAASTSSHVRPLDGPISDNEAASDFDQDDDDEDWEQVGGLNHHHHQSSSPPRVSLSLNTPFSLANNLGRGLKRKATQQYKAALGGDDDPVDDSLSATSASTSSSMDNASGDDYPEDWQQAGANADAQDLAGPGAHGKLDCTVSKPQKENEGTQNQFISYLVTTDVCPRQDHQQSLVS